VSSKYLFRRPWLTVRCEDMLLPNGNHIPEYYILEYPDWVNTIAITKEGKFVFVRQYRPGIGRTCYELCAGVCEKEDVSPLVSAQRELWEETGYGNGNWQEYMVVSANPSTHTNLTHCFLATDVELIDHQHLEATEDISVHLFTLEEGQKFMTTSCCPSYIELVEKHIPGMKPYVSSTGSPMYYAARIAKEKHPDAKIVFVGPCIAKRKEVRRDEAVDYILTFEEIGSILDGFDIQLEQMQEFSILHTSVREAHGFAQAGGVMGAVKAYLKEEAEKINAIQVSDINKKNIALLRACAKTGKAAGQFIEVMACEGGCITGPSTHNDIVSGRRQLVQELLKRKESYETMDR
jgi:8-oxo-dGTP pyrophosphatase MutT (NUDIX family)